MAKARRAEREVALRKRCIAELSLNEALDGHWRDADALMRQVDAKDSIFELERLRKLIIGRFVDSKIARLEVNFPANADGKRSADDERLYQQDFAEAVQGAKDFGDEHNLRRLYYAAATMDMLRRHNRQLRKQLRHEDREAAWEQARLRRKVRELQTEIRHAEREKWCLDGIKLWEPHRYARSEPKVLALARTSEREEEDEKQQRWRRGGGPKSLLSSPERCGKGLVRLVGKLQVTPDDYAVQQGRTFTDAIARPL